MKIIETLFRLVIGIQRSRGSLNSGTHGWHFEVMLLKQLVKHGDNHCWYAEMPQRLESHGIHINALPVPT